MRDAAVARVASHAARTVHPPSSVTRRSHSSMSTIAQHDMNMVYAHTTFNTVFAPAPNDVYWCTADCGWITGHTYIVYGPLLAGATTMMFEARAPSAVGGTKLVLEYPPEH